MYTRCSDCETLFRVSQEQLNAARGQVRCGRCGNVFDALASLREEVLETPSRRDESIAPPFLLIDETRARQRPWLWLVVFAALAFALQLVHAKRADLATHPMIGPYLSATYDFLGVPLVATTRIDLNAFALLHHELVTNPRRSGALHLSGVLSNDADFAQPWPTLELRLEDRFGEVVAARRLQPDEYLRNPPDDEALMPAHARRAIEVEFLDPGHDAVGFRIDFCVSAPDGFQCGGNSEQN